jgi:hypothetical protein
MKHKFNRLLMGTAVTVAAIAAAIDHTKHQLPEPEQAGISGAIIIQDDDDDGGAPCSLNIDAAPCSLN